MTIIYAEEPELAFDDFVGLLGRSALGGQRPLDDTQRMRTILAGADLIMTARDSAADGALIGVARCLTDHAWACYCADLAVDEGYVGRGVSRELLAAARRQLHPQCRFHVIAAAEDEAVARDAGLTPLVGAFHWAQD